MFNRINPIKDQRDLSLWLMQNVHALECGERPSGKCRNLGGNR